CGGKGLATEPRVAPGKKVVGARGRGAMPAPWLVRAGCHTFMSICWGSTLLHWLPLGGTQFSLAGVGARK
ncbi:hypothetical protein SK128_013388, partial [Halocaridina rubra]